MKKLLAILLAAVLCLGLFACGETEQQQPSGDDTVAITLWTYPIGKWGEEATVKSLIEEFNKVYPKIQVTVEYLDYTNGDDQVNTAIEGSAAPDLIMEGPERLVANWGAKGYMVDIADMLDATDKKEINAACLAACVTADGKCYEYPVVMTAHCMAVNYTKAEEAGVANLINKDTHKWTTAQYVEFCQKMNAYYEKDITALYCSGQGGDQGTRALVNNLYGGTFTNAEHTAYTANDPKNVKALELLQGLAGVTFDASINGGEEITLFRQGQLYIANCWNIAQQLNTDNNEAGLTNDGDEIVFMEFPAEDGEAKLQGGIWGFGIFDNGDEKKIDAAKKFIKYFADGEGTASAVKAASYFAVRDTAEGIDLTGIWADNAIMNEYTKLMPNLGDYYQVTTNWAVARTEWWNMLQRIGTGGNVADEVETFCNNANAK